MACAGIECTMCRRVAPAPSPLGGNESTTSCFEQAQVAVVKRVNVDVPGAGLIDGCAEIACPQEWHRLQGVLEG